MFGIKKTHFHGATKLVTTDRSMIKVKTFKTEAGAQRWIAGKYGQSHVSGGWVLEVVTL